MKREENIENIFSMMDTIGYWCDTVETVDKDKKKVVYKTGVREENWLACLHDGGFLKFYDAESDDVWYMDLKSLNEAITKRMKVHDAEDFDGCDTDVIIQTAIFGKLVFG